MNGYLHNFLIVCLFVCLYVCLFVWPGYLARLSSSWEYFTDMETITSEERQILTLARPMRPSSIGAE